MIWRHFACNITVHTTTRFEVVVAAVTHAVDIVLTIGSLSGNYVDGVSIYGPVILQEDFFYATRYTYSINLPRAELSSDTRATLQSYSSCID